MLSTPAIRTLVNGDVRLPTLILALPGRVDIPVPDVEVAPL